MKNTPPDGWIDECSRHLAYKMGLIKIVRLVKVQGSLIVTGRVSGQNKLI